MATDKKDKVKIRYLRVKPTDDLKTMYAKYRKAFTAADLQKYTEIEPMYPVEPLIAELEAIHREAVRNRRKKKTK